MDSYSADTLIKVMLSNNTFISDVENAKEKAVFIVEVIFKELSICFPNEGDLWQDRVDCWINKVREIQNYDK